VKLMKAVCALLVLLPGGKASATGTDPIGVTIHCNCEDVGGQSYMKAVVTAVGQHPEFHMVSVSSAGDAVHIEITSHEVVSAGGKRQAHITVVSEYAGARATDSFMRSCDQIQMSDVAQATVDGLHDLF
jgi:hypothetical protein